MAVKVAINGFGRIGRLAFRQMFGAEGYEVVAINDLTSPKMLAHLLKYDSAQGRYEKADTVVAGEDSITVDGKTIKIYAEKDAINLPWGELGVDVVLECTGFYTTKEKAEAHIKAGAKKVVISAPAGKDLPTVVFGVNENILKNIPKKNKFKVYISPLTYLNIDDDNRISMTDLRLLRRIVRDNRTRGYSPSTTLNNWEDVRKGEEKYVFPYQDNANVMFNTSLAYELGVLKTYVEPLLYTVKADDPEYLTARRLLELLKCVLPISSESVPQISIIREFIGGSYFE